MSNRGPGVRAVSVLVLIFPVVMAMSAEGQSAPKTAWGDPDLQGIWTSSGATPFERPNNLSGREILTDEEVSSIRAATTARDEELQSHVDGRRPAGWPASAANARW